MKKLLISVLFVMFAASVVFAAQHGGGGAAPAEGEKKAEGGGESSSAGAKVDPAYDLYNKALDLYEVHDYKAAIKLLKKVIKKKPEFAKAYNFAGLSYIANKQLGHAIFMYKKAVYTNPEFAEAFYNLGVAYELKKEPKNAEAQYLKVLELENDNSMYVRASLNLAEIYREEKKFDDATALLRKAMVLEPAFAELYNAAGLVYLDSEEELKEPKLLDFAQKNFELALDKEVEYVEASVNLGVTLQRKGKLSAAIAQFEKALGINYNFPGAHYNYANALSIADYKEKAIEHYKAAIKLDPEFKEAYYGLGKTQFKSNMFDDAEKSLKKAIDLDKDYAQAKQVLYDMRELRKEFRKHLTFKKKAVEGEEGEEAGEEGGEGELDEEAAAELAKKKAEELKKNPYANEDVEDLRLPEEKKTPVEGEEEE